MVTWSVINSKYITIKLIFSCLLQKFQDTNGTSTEIIEPHKIKDNNEEGEINEVRIEMQEPILSDVKITIDKEKENADTKSLLSLLSDYFFILIGTCFYVAWAEVIVQAILLLIVFFAFIKSIQLCIKDFKMDVQFNIWIR